MSKTELKKKLHLPSKKVLIVVILILVVIMVAALAGIHFFKGDEKVEFKILGEKEVPQQIASQVIPEYRQLERALACTVDDKVYVIASRGEKPTSGYQITIKKLVMKEKNGVKSLQVYTEFKDPEPGTALTQVLTYPLQVAKTDLTALPDQIELKVQYDE